MHCFISFFTDPSSSSALFDLFRCSQEYWDLVQSWLAFDAKLNLCFYIVRVTSTTAAGIIILLSFQTESVQPVDDDCHSYAYRGNLLAAIHRFLITEDGVN